MTEKETPRHKLYVEKAKQRMTTIKVSETVWRTIRDNQELGETMNETLVRLLDKYIQDFDNITR